MIGPVGQHVTKTFILEGHRPPMKQKFDAVSLSKRVFLDLGECQAATSCRAEYQQKDKRFALRFFRLWRKVEGQWRLTGSVTAITG